VNNHMPSWWDSVLYDMVLMVRDIGWQTSYVDCDVIAELCYWQDRMPTYDEYSAFDW